MIVGQGLAAINVRAIFYDLLCILAGPVIITSGREGRLYRAQDWVSIR